VVIPQVFVFGGFDVVPQSEGEIGEGKKTEGESQKGGGAGATSAKSIPEGNKKGSLAEKSLLRQNTKAQGGLKGLLFYKRSQ